MTPGARLQAAIELFLTVETSTVPADITLDGYFRGKRFVGAKDRRAISERVFGLLRRQARLEWWINYIVGPGAIPPLSVGLSRARVIADLVLFDKVPADYVEELFSGGRHCPDALSPQEAELAHAMEGREVNHPDMPDWARYEYPGWLDPVFRDLWGDGLTDEMAAFNEPAQLDFRVNTLKADRKRAQAALAGEGVECEETPISPIGLRVDKRIRLGGTMAFRDGLVDVQDEGSQLLSLLCDARPGMTVIDYCAGAGGKTLAMAAQMQGKGTLVASDISPKRLHRLDGRLKRSGASGVICQPLPRTLPGWLAKYHGQADRVLLDVPCSGMGTWRRSPDSKWRLTPGSLERTNQRQSEILEAGKVLVKTGGRLIYATCSLLPSENEERIVAFLQDNPNFKPIPIGTVWKQTIGTDCPVEGPYLRLSPLKHATDGFFAAVLERLS